MYNAWLLQGRFDRFIARVSAHHRLLNGDWPASEKAVKKIASSLQSSRLWPLPSNYVAKYSVTSETNAATTHNTPIKL